jgi:MFS family permease
MLFKQEGCDMSADEAVHANDAGSSCDGNNAGDMSLCAVVRSEIVQLKWRALLFMCFMCFGSYYIYDFPGSIGTGHHHSIESRFLDHGKQYTQEMNQALYSVYSWPNTVLAVFGGLLIDKYIGLRRATLLFATLVLIGSIIFYFGVVTTQYGLLVAGRIVFGLGGESLFVAQSAYVARFFNHGRGIALAFAIAISFARVGSSCNFLLSPMIATNHGITTAALCGIFACFVTVGACSGIVAMDVYASKQGILPAESLSNNTAMKLRDVFRFPKAHWLICGICVAIYCSIFPLIAVAKNFFEVKYNISGDEAAKYVSVYQFVCAACSPMVGIAVDTVGRMIYWTIASGVGFTGVHLLFILASPTPVVMMALMGVIYSFLVSSLWPAVPFIVSAELVGLAYGIMTAMQNAGLATFPLIAGAILDGYTPEQKPLCSTLLHNGTLPPRIDCTNTTSAPLPTAEGYRYTEMLFMGAAAAGTVLAVVLLIVDKATNNGMLSAAPARRAELKAKMVTEHQALLGVLGGVDDVGYDAGIV